MAIAGETPQAERTWVDAASLPLRSRIELESGPDGAAFDPWRIQPVTHDLVRHPLLQPAALIELGTRLESRGSVRTHSAAATAATSFGAAPRLHPNARSAADTLSSINDAHAWMSLLNVQADPQYQELIGSVLDRLAPLIDTHDPGMCHRAGWIFVSSPRAVTPFHFDKEHNFILQIAGHKRVYVWEPDDNVVASEAARDRFHDCHERDLLVWSDAFRERARVFDLAPGQGAYMPSTSPHLVENGPGPSITISLTYYTDATRRAALLHKAHATLRRLGIDPPAVGAQQRFDAIVHAGLRNSLRARAAIRRLAGRDAASGCARFAPVES